MIAYRNFFRKVSPTHPPDTKTCRRTRTSSRVCPRPAFQVYELHTVPTTKLDLRRFKGCLAAASVPMEIDEIECILANLVYTGCARVPDTCTDYSLLPDPHQAPHALSHDGTRCRYIKGYISHQHAKLVVAKGNAFPPLRDVLGES